MNCHEASRSGATPGHRPTSGAVAARRYRAGGAFGWLPLGERAGKGSVRRGSNRARFDAVADRAAARCPSDVAWRCRVGESLRQRWRSLAGGRRCSRKPRYGPEIGHKGLAEIAAAAPVPVLAIGGLNATRAAEVLAAGPVGIAVMGSIMRAIDPGREMKALLAIVAGAHPRAR